MATPLLPPCPSCCTRHSRKTASNAAICASLRLLGLALAGVPRSCGGKHLPLSVCSSPSSPSPSGRGLYHRVRGFRDVLMIIHTFAPQREIPLKRSQASGPRRNRQCESSLVYRNHSQAQSGYVAATTP